MTKEYIVEELGRRQAARKTMFPLTQEGLRELQEFLDIELQSILGHSDFKVWVDTRGALNNRLTQPTIVIEETRTIRITQ